MSVEGLGDPLTRAVDPDVLLARAYLSRVVEPPGTAVVRWLSDKDPREAAASVRAGSVPDDVADQVRARREVDQAAEDLAILDACGGRLIVPESPEWPSLAFRAFSPRVPSGAVADERTTAPIALWARGPAAPVDAERRAVAVVGARAATDYGAWVARHCPPASPTVGSAWSRVRRWASTELPTAERSPSAASRSRCWPAASTAHTHPATPD